MEHYTLVFDWQWAAPLLFILGGLIVGIMVERTIIAGVQKVIDVSDLDLSDRVAGLFQGVIFWLFTLGGIYMATFSLSAYMGDNFLSPIRRLLFILAMLMAIRLASNVVIAFVHFYLNRNEQLRALPNTSILENIVRAVVYLVGILVLLQSVGISVIPILTALGVGGLAISLALQDTLANIFAGINMLMARQIKIGDFVKLESGFEGTVEDIGWRNTLIRKLNNNLIIVPNSKMASSIIINSSLPRPDLEPEMSVVLDIGVSYHSDLEKVEEVTLAIARQTLQEVEGGVAHWEPTVRFHTFGDSAILFSVSLRVRDPVDQYAVKHRFIQLLYARYRQEGIEIPFPQRVLHLDPQLASIAAGKSSGQKPRGEDRRKTSATRKQGEEPS